MPRLKDSRRERFCREYIKDLNGAAAYVRAGYSPKGSNAGAARLLANVSIKARIAELQKKIEKTLHDDAKMLRDNLRLMAQVEITDIFNDDWTIKVPSEMTKGARLLISGVDIKQLTVESDNDDEIKTAVLIKLKTESTLKAQELLGKHHEVSAWEENINLNDGEDRVARIRRAQERAGKRGGKKK